MILEQIINNELYRLPHIDEEQVGFMKGEGTRVKIRYVWAMLGKAR